MATATASATTSASNQLPLISLCETVAKISMPTLVQASTVASSPQRVNTPSSVAVAPSDNVFKLQLSNGELHPITNSVPKLVPAMATLTVSRGVEVPTSGQKPIIVTVSGMHSLGGGKQLTSVTNVLTTPLLSAPIQMIAPHFTTDKLQGSSNIVTLPSIPRSTVTSGPLVIPPPAMQAKSKAPSHIGPIIPGSIITSKGALGQLPVVIASSSFLTNSATSVVSTITPVTLSSNIVTVTPVIMTSGAPPVSIPANSAIAMNHTGANQAQVLAPVIQGAVKAPIVTCPKTIVPAFIKPVTITNSNTNSLSVVAQPTAVTQPAANGFNPKSDPMNPDFDPVHAMEWKDGVGSLPGSDIKFKVNEFGTLEIITEDPETAESSSNAKEATPSPQKPNSPPPAQPVTTSSETETSARNGLKESFSKMKEMYQPVSENSAGSKQDGSEDIKSDVSAELCRCENCDCFGLKVEFCKSGRFCSQACVTAFSNRKNNLCKRGAGKDARKKKRRKSSLSDEDDKETPVKEAKRELEPSSSPNKKEVADEPVPMEVEKSFNWEEYLKNEKAIAAPTKLFSESQSFPVGKNAFEVGMKLEAIDPKHPSLFCVVTVAEIRGFRVRLHFDGYSERYDFWVNADSPDIFPVGWCEKTGHKLQPPKGFTPEEFCWESYLKLSPKFVAAPKHLFIVNDSKPSNNSGFRLGMKLEAVDKKNSSLVCVATVTDVMDNRFLIHFDGWEDIYDYWVDPCSPSIHPINWCRENGHDLTPPKDYKGDSFCWSRYLSECKAVAVPSRSFKQSSVNGFRPGMKIEAVDKRNPLFIRVATISDRTNHSLLIHFDGWSSAYDYWVDDDCPDIHPVSWCQKTGHPLEPPVDSSKVPTNGQNSCPTPGCPGLGHIKGPKHTTHHSSFGCPYSQLNINKIDTLFQDRVTVTKETLADIPKPKSDQSSTTEGLRRCPTPGCNGTGHVKGKYSVHHGVSGCPLAAQQDPLANSSGSSSPQALSSVKSAPPTSNSSASISKPLDYLRNRNCKGKKKKVFGTGLRGRPPKALVLLRAQQAAQQRREASLKQSSISEEIHKSVFNSPFVKSDHPPCSDRIIKLLPKIESINFKKIKSWTVDEVANFVSELTDNEEMSKIFVEQLIDGEAFILLNQDDMTKIMKIKLGAALKIFHSIVYFRCQLSDDS